MMRTHHQNPPPLGISDNLAKSIELAAQQSQSVMFRSMGFGAGVRRGIGSVKARFRVVKKRIGLDGVKRLSRTVSERREPGGGAAGVGGVGVGVVVDVKEGEGKGKGVDEKEGGENGVEERPVTERGRRRRRSRRMDDSAVVESTGKEVESRGGLDESKRSGGLDKSKRSDGLERVENVDVEESLYDGSEVEPFEFPWSSPPLDKVEFPDGENAEGGKGKGKGIQVDKSFATEDGDQQSENLNGLVWVESEDDSFATKDKRYLTEDHPSEISDRLVWAESEDESSTTKDERYQGENLDRAIRGERENQVKLVDQSFTTEDEHIWDLNKRLESQQEIEDQHEMDAQHENKTDEESLNDNRPSSLFNSGTQPPMRPFVPEAITILKTSDTDTQIYHRPGSSDISNSTDSKYLDHSSDIGCSRSVQNRVLPYTQQPDHTKFAALPMEIGELLATMIRVYNGNFLHVPERREFGDQRRSNNVFALIHNVSVLTTSLLLPPDRSCTLTRTMMQELLGLGTATPACHRDADILDKMREKGTNLLRELEEWAERLEQVRSLLVAGAITGSDVAEWQNGDIERLYEHRRRIRKVCDEVLVVSCGVEVRFGEVGRILRRDGLEDRMVDNDEDCETDVEFCVKCRVKIIDTINERVDETKGTISREKQVAILAQLRRGIHRS